MMPGMDTRQMAAMMKRMGVDMRDVDGVEEVVVRTATKEYRFRRPAVSIMKAQGQETWQIQGKAVATDRTAAPAASAPSGSAAPAVSSQAPQASTVAAPAASTSPSPAAAYTPSADDVKVVMEAARVPEAKAREALVATGGDLAEAILRLAS